MKKTFVIPVLLALSLLLSGCMTYHQVDYIDPENVVSISFYDLRDIHAYSGFHTKYETVFTLDPARNSEFIYELSSLQFSQLYIPGMDPSFKFSDWTVRIDFYDGSFMLLSDGGYLQTLDAQDETLDQEHTNIDSELWLDFVSSYLPAELLES